MRIGTEEQHRGLRKAVSTGAHAERAEVDSAEHGAADCSIVLPCMRDGVGDGRQIEPPDQERIARELQRLAEAGVANGHQVIMAVLNHAPRTS